MAHHNTILSQLLQRIPRHQFEQLSQKHNGIRRKGALSRWSTFVALAVGHLGHSTSLRDIESTFRSQQQHHYHLGNQTISRYSD